MTTTVITKTNKGHRVWLQGLTAKGFSGRFNVTFGKNAILVTFPVDGSGKRKLTAAKGGIVDIESKKVTQWACGAESASVEFGSEYILITRA